MSVATPIEVLFVCVHNSARSVMAEKFACLHGDDIIQASSAGFDPKPILPLALEVMEERGLDISSHQSHSVYDLHRDGFCFEYVVLLCDDTHGYVLPRFPGAIELNWQLPEPSRFSGSHEIQIRNTRVVRDSIENLVKSFIADLRGKSKKT